MAVFKLGSPVETRAPEVQVDPGLKQGVYVFQLVVVNDRGRASQPASVRLVVR